MQIFVLANRTVVILTAVVFLVLGMMEKDPRFHAKKPLSMTARAQRVFVAGLVMAFVSRTVLVKARVSILLWVI